jgi:hydroxypyruvate isomerase
LRYLPVPTTERLAQWSTRILTQVRRIWNGMVQYGQGLFSMPNRDLSILERLASLEVKLEESKEDRLKIHANLREAQVTINEKLDRLTGSIQEQVREQAKRTTFVESLKWVIGMCLSVMLGYIANSLGHAVK